MVRTNSYENVLLLDRAMRGVNQSSEKEYEFIQNNRISRDIYRSVLKAKIFADFCQTCTTFV